MFSRRLTLRRCAENASKDDRRATACQRLTPRSYSADALLVPPPNPYKNDFDRAAISCDNRRVLEEHVRLHVSVTRAF